MTVEAVLDAVAAVLERDGVEAVTTNRIAEVAGVSIGSVYQYFPDKRAIFVALHERHVEEVAHAVERALVEHAESPLDALVRALVEAMIDAHSSHPRLYELLSTEVPHRADAVQGFEARQRGAFRLALSARAAELPEPRELDRKLFALMPMLEALVHAVAFRRPARLSLSAAKDEAVRAVLAYLRA